MSSGTVLVSRVTELDFAELLPLIAKYQEFYETPSDDAHNFKFFLRFITSEAEGVLLGARSDAAGPLVGYACLHWRLDTVGAREVVCLHDLYVDPNWRRTGIGAAIISAAADIARSRGAAALVWTTAPDNTTAQSLYHVLGATSSAWIEYELPLESSR